MAKTMTKSAPKNEKESDIQAMEKAMENIQKEVEAGKTTETIETVAPEAPINLAIPVRKVSHIIQIDCRPLSADLSDQIETEIKAIIGDSAEYHGHILGGGQSVFILHCFDAEATKASLKSTKLLPTYANDLIITELHKPGNPTIKENFSK